MCKFNIDGNTIIYKHAQEQVSSALTVSHFTDCNECDMLAQVAFYTYTNLCGTNTLLTIFSTIARNLTISEIFWLLLSCKSSIADIKDNIG